MLDLIDLHRRYGDVVAVDGVSFSVPPGRIVGFVGRNGSGKTTTMRAVLGLVRPDRGQVRWRGAPITAADRLRIGYLPEERGLYPRMRVAHQLVHLARLSGVDPAMARERTGRWLDRLGLADRAGDRLEELSLGNQQRVQLAAALVHDPELAILDEPFSGLDPVGVDVMSETLLAEAAAGRGVLFSSHQLELVERLCDDVVVIEAGRVVAQESVGAQREAPGAVSLADRFRQLVPR